MEKSSSPTQLPPVVEDASLVNFLTALCTVERPNLLQENNYLDAKALMEGSVVFQQRDSLFPDLSSVEDEVYFSTLLLQCKEIKQVVELTFLDGVLMEEDLVLQQSLFTLPPVKDAPLVGFHHRPHMIDLINFVMFFSPFPFVQTIPCGHLPYMANYVPNVTVTFILDGRVTIANIQRR